MLLQLHAQRLANGAAVNTNADSMNGYSKKYVDLTVVCNSEGKNNTASATRNNSNAQRGRTVSLDTKWLRKVLPIF